MMPLYTKNVAENIVSKIGNRIIGLKLDNSLKSTITRIEIRQQNNNYRIVAIGSGIENGIEPYSDLETVLEINNLTFDKMIDGTNDR